VATPINRPLRRETREVERGRPLVVELVPGGKILRIRPKGTRRWYTVTWRQVWVEAVRALGVALRAEKAARRKKAR